MRETLLSDSKKALLMTAAVFFVLPVLIVSTVQALSNADSANTGMNNNYYVRPYTGGAPIAKVLYPADGSTVTITSTGAVIKQGFGRTPYREGWINPSDIGSITTPADLRGRLVSGSKNPYNVSSSTNTNTNINTNTNKQATQPTSQSTSSATVIQQVPQPPASSSSASTASSTANATANANVTVTGSQAAVPSQTQTSVQTSAAAPASSQAQSSVGKTLPNTGPGEVFAIGGITSVFSTVGHLLYQRFRLRSGA